MDRALLVLCALLLNAALCGPRKWVAGLGFERVSGWPGRQVLHLERKLNRDHRSGADREMRGWLLLIAAIILCVLGGGLSAWLLRHNLRFFELMIIAAMLPVRPIWDRAAAIRSSLAAGDIAGARQMLTGTPWRHHALLDEFGVARAAIETTAVDFSEKLVCPILGYVWLGLPGLFLSKLITVMRDALSHTPEFSKGTRVAHAVIHTLPSRLSTAFWLATVLFLPSGSINAAVKRVTTSFLTEAPRPLCVHAAAGVVRVSLGGPVSPYLSTWAENGSVQVRVADIKRAQAAYIFATVFLFIFTGAFFW